MKNKSIERVIEEVKARDMGRTYYEGIDVSNDMRLVDEVERLQAELREVTGLLIEVRAAALRQEIQDQHIMTKINNLLYDTGKRHG